MLKKYFAFLMKDAFLMLYALEQFYSALSLLCLFLQFVGTLTIVELVSLSFISLYFHNSFSFFYGPMGRQGGHQKITG